MRILVTGGAGYIGSHTCIELINAGYDIVVLDNLCNSSLEPLKRIESICHYNIPFYKVDIRHKNSLISIFQKYKFDGVIHFAGLKAVGESVISPIEYYDNNVNGSLVLLEVMRDFNCKNIVFSSSATVYGEPFSVPILENFPLSAINPYGRSKLMIEDILKDVAISGDNWNIVILRYFNPVGAHKSGNIGEDPTGIPNNLMPYISKVAAGKLDKLNIFGGNYDTIDGTGIRDYIHVVDIAKGHIKALHALGDKSQVLIFNLGTGKGYSVLDIVKVFEEVSGKSIPYEIVKRRPGDVAICYADSTYAESFLGWTAENGLKEMCEDTWRWQKSNPNGYKR